MIDRPKLPTLKEQLLTIGFTRRNCQFSNGQEANNKVELDFARLAQYPDVYKKVIRRMCELVEPHAPGFFVGVPNGATRIAEKLAREYCVPHIVLTSDPSTKTMDYLNDKHRAAVLDLKNGVLTEDVFRTGSNLERALNVSELASRLAIGVCVLDRSVANAADPGDQILELSKDLEILSVAREPIPSMLPEDSELFKLYAATQRFSTA